MAPEHPYIPHTHISPACSNNHLSSLSCFLRVLAAARPHETSKTLFPQLHHNICTDKPGYQKSSIEVAAFAVRNTDEWQAQTTELIQHRLSQSHGMENSSMVNNSVTQNPSYLPKAKTTTQKWILNDLHEADCFPNQRKKRQISQLCLGMIPQHIPVLWE